MLTYEQFITLLIEALERNEVNIAHTQELLDTHALWRSLHITCLPPGVDRSIASKEHTAHAVISLRWPAELTVAAMQSQNLPDLAEQLLEQPSYPTRSGGLLEMELTYYLPISEPQPSTARLTEMVKSVYRLFADQPRLDDMFAVNCTLSFQDTESAKLSQVNVTKIFPINDLIFDMALLDEALAAVSVDVKQMLPRLHLAYSERGSDSESGFEPPFYLRPPTA